MSKRVMIQWTNKYSGEIGYVAKINKKEGYFENAENKEDARTWLNVTLAAADVDFLVKVGEGENNEFSIIPA